jgi:hypothetical protein
LTKRRVCWKFAGLRANVYNILPFTPLLAISFVALKSTKIYRFCVDRQLNSHAAATGLSAPDDGSFAREAPSTIYLLRLQHRDWPAVADPATEETSSPNCLAQLAKGRHLAMFGRPLLSGHAKTGLRDSDVSPRAGRKRRQLLLLASY